VHSKVGAIFPAESIIPLRRRLRSEMLTMITIIITVIVDMARIETSLTAFDVSFWRVVARGCWEVVARGCWEMVARGCWEMVARGCCWEMVARGCWGLGDCMAMCARKPSGLRAAKYWPMEPLLAHSNTPKILQVV
jgi:hypothetical protein